MTAAKPKSIRKPAVRVLGTTTKQPLRDFLLDSVNLFNPIDFPPDGPAHFKRWVRRWGDRMTYRANDRQARVPLEYLESLAPILRSTLRRIWSESDARQREWYAFRLRETYLQLLRHLEGWSLDTSWKGPRQIGRMMDYGVQQAPPLSFFEAAILWAQKNESRMLHCAGPRCPAPYMLRRGRGQRYCADCADRARSASKLRWWNKNRKGSSANV